MGILMRGILVAWISGLVVVWGILVWGILLVWTIVRVVVLVVWRVLVGQQQVHLPFNSCKINLFFERSLKLSGWLSSLRLIC